MYASLDEHHADHIHAARRAAHPERDANAAAAEHAADEAFGKLVTVQNACARDEGQKIVVDVTDSSVLNTTRWSSRFHPMNKIGRLIA